jgi:hypothetical protein
LTPVSISYLEKGNERERDKNSPDQRVVFGTRVDGCVIGRESHTGHRELGQSHVAEKVSEGEGREGVHHVQSR